MRRFDPADQRSTGKADAFTLMPASEALLDEETIKRFRARYREQFGANATGDPLYQAISSGRRMAGMEHWLPLFEEKLATLFDHLGDHDVIVRDSNTDGSLEARHDAIDDYFANREKAMVAEPGSYRPLAPSTLCSRARRGKALSKRPITSPHRSFNRKRQGHRFGVDGPRDFAPERTQGTNL
jgi:transcription-repair coupling factor (superfamily II helicase)